MSVTGKYFKIIDGSMVDLTDLFQEDGTNNNTYYPDLDISNTAKGDDVAYARPDNFGYKIKDENGTITDLSEYCVINPEYFDVSSNVDVTIYNSMSGYIVGGSGGGGGGSGGAYDTTWGSNDHNGADGGVGGAGEVKWFADINLTGVNNINISVGAKGNGGGGGARYRGSGGWSKPGGTGNDGKESEIYSGNQTNDNNYLLVNSLGGGGGNGGNKVSTSGSGGNAGNSGKCGGHDDPSHKTHNDSDFTNHANYWNNNYTYITPLVQNSTEGGNKGGGGTYNNNNANSGNGGGKGDTGFGVLYLKR